MCTCTQPDCYLQFPMSLNLPNTLYHYCSIDSFFHIINSKSIWLSNSSQMNDSSENVWIEKYFDQIKDYFSHGKYGKFINKVIDTYYMNNHPPYIFCLSEKKDLLSQWRAYSQDGHGISIGFNTKNLRIQNIIPAPNVYAINTLGIYKVKYSIPGQKNRISKLCESFKQDFKKSDDVDSILEFSSSLNNMALVFKNPSFKEEREWRIMHTPIFDEIPYEEPLDQLSGLNFRPQSNRILTYFSYDFGENFDSN